MKDGQIERQVISELLEETELENQERQQIIEKLQKRAKNQLNVNKDTFTDIEKQTLNY